MSNNFNKIIFFAIFFFGLLLILPNFVAYEGFQVQAQCHCCSGSGPNGECLNHEGCGANCCSWPWDLCPPPRPRCSAGKWVGWCDGGGGGCDANNWGGWSACSAPACPAGFGGLTYGSQSRTNDCGDTQSQSCSRCCALNPLAPVLNAPPHKSDVNTVTPTLTWTATTRWGYKCPNPQNAYYQIQISKLGPTGICNQPAFATVNVASTITSYLIPRTTNLEWGVTYCWRVAAVNNAAVFSQFFEFTPIIDEFFMTYGGDVYISTGLPDPIKTSPVLETITLGENFTGNNAKTKYAVVKTFLNRTLPYMSTNVFAAPNIGSGSARGSSRGINVPFTDKSMETYAKPYSATSGGRSRSYTASMYAYYLEKLQQEKFASKFSSLSLTKRIFSSNTQQTVRSLLGVTNTADSLIVNLTNQSPGMTFELRSNTTVQPQRGYTYDSDRVFDLRSLDDWQTTRPTVPIERINCDKKTIFLVPGNLIINANIMNLNAGSSCIFIVEGHLAIVMPDVFVTPATATTYSRNYRILEGLFFANSVSFSGKDDQSTVLVNGGIYTNNSATTGLEPVHYDPFRGNKFDILTNQLERPQEFFVYDPRHIVFWASELEGESQSARIRESRFLRLFGGQNVDLVPAPPIN